MEGIDIHAVQPVDPLCRFEQVSVDLRIVRIFSEARGGWTVVAQHDSIVRASLHPLHHCGIARTISPWFWLMRMIRY
jgi:hypothetical protein